MVYIVKWPKGVENALDLAKLGDVGPHISRRWYVCMNRKPVLVGSVGEVGRNHVVASVRQVRH
jgi:hypothetical protein